MQRVGTSIVFSPSDLNHFLECEHLVQLDRAHDGEAARLRDAHADLLAAKGVEHERAWLETFRADGLAVVSLDAPGGERDWERDAARTLAAMRDGAEVIYQGVLVGEGWHGVSDFLVRVDRPSTLGGWSYEAWDAKLARHSKPYFILQLCFYTERIAALQGLLPTWMHVVLGTGERQAYRYRDFDAYYRSVRRRFLDAAREERPTSPYPVPHCGLCHHAAACQSQWQAEDHLSLVAGIRRDQVQRLNEAGLGTVAELARLDPNTRLGIGTLPLRRLVHQAALQTHHRRTGQHRYELLPVDAHTGFRLLPEPSPGDVFFDMEGYPYFEPAGGLEYLFGVMTTDGGRPEFRPFQAATRAEEKVAFERFIDFIDARLRRWPDLHVYHYASYEPAALKRLMSEHATREDVVDALLRREVFVDLYQVVRQSLRISHASYSIKKVRTFFMPNAGQGAVADGGDSILEFEKYLRTGDARVLEAIVRYNEEDCLSTVMLRDWLLDRREEAERSSGRTIAWKVPADAALTPERVQEDSEIRTLRERLEARGNASAALLGQLLNYHRREAKPEWWAYFDRQKKPLDDLLDDTEAIAYLEPVPDIAPVAEKKSFVYTLAFPAQEFKLAVGDDVEDPATRQSAGKIVWLDARAGRLGLKRGPSLDGVPLPAAVVRGEPRTTVEQRKALCRVADDVLAARGEFPAARALLERAAGDRVQTLDLEQQKRVVAALDGSVLFIQGPPGSGKTWTGARLIVSLLARGRRVGVAANTHKAIHNLLEDVESVAAAERVRFRGLKKSTGADEHTRFEGPSFDNTDDPKACEVSGAQLVAGTSWLFAREGMQHAVDHLFIDEAGQVSLADAVAMSTAARNVVLLGDPQQLPHVTHGVHPGGSGCSVLEHLLGGASTVAEDRGIFLARSWRMHPDVCAFVSELSYDGRLSSVEACARQRVTSPGLCGAGLRYIAVEHDGNAQQSVEEARVIATEVRRLLDEGAFADCQGVTRRMTASDILVVAPYNMQVRCLREALPASVEVGTVDRFQGREAPVVFFSMASSSGDDVPRGLEFLFNRNRFTVAISRAKCLSVVVGSPRLLETRCRSVEQMKLVNAVCRFVECCPVDSPAASSTRITAAAAQLRSLPAVLLRE
jgi:predicted RecB family nuclease